MYYDVLSKNTVKITLDRQDMRNYSIKSDSLIRRSSESKRALTKFIKKFQSESSVFAGFNADRLFLEAFPSAEGGCILYVSTLGTEKAAEIKPQQTREIMMCGVRRVSDAASLCGRISSLVKTSSLYRTDQRYFVIAVPEKDTDKRLRRIMEEYGEFSSDRTDIAFIAEHGELLCEENAAEVLSRLI